MTRMPGCLLSGLAAIVLCCPAITQAAVIGFEDLTLAPESHWNGQERFDATGQQDGTFSSGGLTFNNHYDEDYGPAWAYWDCFAYSNHTYDVNNPIQFPDPNENMFLGGQYHAVPGAGADFSDTYGISYMGFGARVPTIEIPELVNVESAMITNNNYAYFTMRDGDPFGFTAPFEQDDWFLLTIFGKDEGNNPIGDVAFYLADYQSADPSDHYIIDDWTSVDLSGLAGAQWLEFGLTGSDTGMWGLNTPAYFAIDNITTNVVPEPASIVIFGVGVGLAFAASRRRRRKPADRRE